MYGPLLFLCEYKGRNDEVLRVEHSTKTGQVQKNHASFGGGSLEKDWKQYLAGGLSYCMHGSGAERRGRPLRLGQQ